MSATWKIILISTIIVSPLFSHSLQQNSPYKRPVTEKTVFFRIGNKNLPLKITRYSERRDIVFINLHHNEFTAVDAAKKLLQQHGGILIEIENNRQRNVHFRLGKTGYHFDPNCIFSAAGIKKYLVKNSRYDKKAAHEIEQLGKRILNLIPEDVLCVIALHNNTDGAYSALSYTEGLEKATDAAQVHIHSANDPDDFFFTTDEKLFKLLSAENYNAVLQDNENCTDDGSLSVYCGKKNIRYVNIETEHGKLSEYREMISILLEKIELK